MFFRQSYETASIPFQISRHSDNNEKTADRGGGWGHFLWFRFQMMQTHLGVGDGGCWSDETRRQVSERNRPVGGKDQVATAVAPLRVRATLGRARRPRRPRTPIGCRREFVLPRGQMRKSTTVLRLTFLDGVNGFNSSRLSFCPRLEKLHRSGANRHCLKPWYPQS